MAESPRYNGQSRPSSGILLHFHLIKAAAGGRTAASADGHKRYDNKRKPNTCWLHTKIVSRRFQLSTTVNNITGF